VSILHVHSIPLASFHMRCCVHILTSHHCKILMSTRTCILYTHTCLCFMVFFGVGWVYFVYNRVPEQKYKNKRWQRRVAAPCGSAVWQRRVAVPCGGAVCSREPSRKFWEIINPPPFSIRLLFFHSKRSFSLCVCVLEFKTLFFYESGHLHTGQDPCTFNLYAASNSSPGLIGFLALAAHI
jgi:hypothetical protein